MASELDHTIKLHNAIEPNSAVELNNVLAVNQKLGFARLLIDKAKALAGDDSIPGRQFQHALLDGACHQLHDALIHFLFEIADDEKLLAHIERSSLPVAVQQLQAAGINNGLLQEIDALLNQSHAPSWLHALIRSKSNPQVIAILFQEQGTAKANDSLLASDNPPSMGPLPTVQTWLINIQNLVERQRTQAVEE